MSAAITLTRTPWRREPAVRSPWLGRDVPLTGSGIRACICFAVTFLTRHKESA